MITPSAWSLLVFLCPTEIQIEAVCGPAVVVDGPYFSLNECEDDAVRRAALGSRHTLVICRPVGMGLRKRAKGYPEKYYFSSKNLCKAPAEVAEVRPAAGGYWFRCGGRR
jgi:hypothetical protein